MINIKNKKLVLITSSIIFAVGFVWMGYGVEGLEIESCYAKSKKYITAEYSDTTVGVDMEGNVYTDTDYWSEPASDVWIVHTHNGNIDDTGYPFDISNGLAVVQYPPHDKSMSRDSYFDNFSQHSRNTYTTYFKDGTYTNDGFHVHDRCMESIGGIIAVKTWYTIRYSITI